MCVELAVLVGEHVRVRHEVEASFPMLLLHPDYVLAQLVLPCDLIARREVVDLLVLVEAFVEVLLAVRVAPKDVPLVGLSVVETVSFEDGPHQFCLAPEYFIEQFLVVYLIAFGVTLSG